MKRIQVLLLGEIHIVRAGVSSLLQNAKGVEVVNDFDNEKAALESIRRLAKELSINPNLILMYIAAEWNWLDEIQSILAEFPETSLIILSLFSSEHLAYQALQAGVAGYLNIDATSAELESAIKAVASGQTYFRPVRTKGIVNGDIRGQRPDENMLRKLTRRQSEVLRLIAEGRTTREIAIELKISVRTVETHRFQLMERLNIRNVAGLVRFAIENKLIISVD